MNRRLIPMFAFAAALVLVAPASALAQTPTPAAPQSHVVSTSALSAAVAGRTATDAENRDVIKKALARTDVRDVARRLGMDVTKADAAVATLSGADLARAAEPARALDANLAGGDVVVISITTLLLVLILIVLIAK